MVTDQQAVSFMFDGRNRGKVKNDKIQRWRLELACFDFAISFRAGRQNTVADALSRASCIADEERCASTSSVDLESLHTAPGHPGITCLWYAVRVRNLPFSLDDVRSIVRRCSTCAEIKSQFIKSVGCLVKSTRPFERLSIDFKGPVPSSTKNKYILNIIDEYSRFPFAFATTNTSAETSIRCLLTLFSVFGLPEYIHSDRGPAFTSGAYQDFLHRHGVSTSYSSAYNPRGNGQIERYNGILWKTIRLRLSSKQLPIERWESVLSEALHCIRSLLCTTTNCIPHERLFSFPRKATFGEALPSWLIQSDSALLRKVVRDNNAVYSDIWLLHLF